MSPSKAADKCLRIAVLNRHFGKRFGGAEHYSVAIAEQLAQRHEVHVFAQEIEHPMVGLQAHRISRPLRKPRWFNQLWYAAATWWHTRTGFDAVLSHENTWHGQIQTIHVRPFKTGLFHQRTGWRKALKWLALATSPRLLTYWWLEKARMRPDAHRAIVATSSAVRQEILQAYPATASMLHTITPGVTLPTTSPDKAGMRAQLGLPASAPLALFVGNDYLKKGLPTLLRAMAHLPPLHLAVVGNTTHLATCQQQAQSLGLADRVHFLGALADMAPAYQAADFLVHPTTEDTYAMVVVEAMAHCLPVIVSGPRHCGVAAELVHQQDALLLDDPQDADALRGLIAQLQASPELAKRLAQAGRRFASQRSWAAAAAQYEVLALACQG